MLDGAVFAFGLAYLVGGGAGRIAALDFFGSTHGGAIGLEWVALVLFAAWGVMAWSARVESNAGKGLVTLVVALGGLALLGEGLIRVQAVFSPRVEAVPSVSTRRWLERHVMRNSLGYRDVEPPAATDSTRRLMIVGDSFAMGWGIADLDARFGERLAEGLGRRTGVDWRPITIAEANRHTLDQLKMVEEAVSYCPDMVVLVYVFNDMDYLRVAGSGRAWSRLTAVPLGLAFVNSQLVQRGILMLRIALSRRPEVVLSQSPYDDSTLVARHLNDLKQFVALASSRGAQSVIVPFEVSGGAVPAVAERYRRFVSLGQGQGLPVLAIDTAFQHHSISDLTISRWDRHPSAVAHGLAAEAVVPQLALDQADPRPACAGGGQADDRR